MRKPKLPLHEIRREWTLEAVEKARACIRNALNDPAEDQRKTIAEADRLIGEIWNMLLAAWPESEKRFIDKMQAAMQAAIEEMQ
jgi:hypothetical protein